MTEQVSLQWISMDSSLYQRALGIYPSIGMFDYYTKTLRYPIDTPPEVIRIHASLLSTYTITQAVIENRSPVLGQNFGVLPLDNHLVIPCDGQRSQLSALLNTVITRINTELVQNNPTIIPIPSIALR